MIQEKGQVDSPVVSCLIYAEPDADHVSAEDKMLTVEMVAHQSAQAFNSMVRDLCRLLGYTIDR